MRAKVNKFYIIDITMNKKKIIIKSEDEICLE